MSKILHENFNKIEISYLDETWEGSPEIEKNVKDSWEKKVQRVEELNKDRPEGEKLVCYNGPMVRLKSSSQEDYRLLIEAQRTDYAHHAITRTNPEIKDRANALYSALLVRLNDNGEHYQVFGTSSGVEKVENVGRLNIIAGSIHPDIDRIDGYPSPGITLQREMIEEFGLTLEAFDGNISPKFMMSESTEFHPSLIYMGIMNMEKKRLEHIHSSYIEREKILGKNPEFSKLAFVKDTENDIQKEIDNDRFHNRVKDVLEYYLTNKDRF